MKAPTHPLWRLGCRLTPLLVVVGLLIGLAGCGADNAPPATATPILPSATRVAPTQAASTTSAPAAATATAPRVAPTETPLPPTATSVVVDLPATLPRVPATETPLPPPTLTSAPPATDTPVPPATATPRPPTKTPAPPAPPTRTAPATRPPTRPPAPPPPSKTPPPPPTKIAVPASTKTPVPPPPPTRTVAAPPSPTRGSAGAGTPPAPVPWYPPVPSGHAYDAYIPAAAKQHQDYHYSCEFDAAWVVLKTYGIDSTVDQMINIVGVDASREPTWEDTPQGAMIYGGDILHYYSGNVKTNFLARSSGQAMRKVFVHYGLSATPVHTQAGIESALRAGSLVWIKTTADFKPGRAATWVLPDGSTYKTVLGNDHAAVVIGYNKDVAVIRDVLGPTSTNQNRRYEYEVPWAHFLEIWAEQSFDGLAVVRP